MNFIVGLCQALAELDVVNAEPLMQRCPFVPAPPFLKVFDDVSAEVIRLLEPDDAPCHSRELRCPSVGQQLRVQQRREGCDIQSVAAREVTLEKSGLKCVSDRASHFFVTTS